VNPRTQHASQTVHSYTISFRTWNRTTRRMSGIRAAKVQAVNRFGALRAWWQVERHWQNPFVEIVCVVANHSDCPKTYDDACKTLRAVCVLPPFTKGAPLAE
jgi:hypothetical protein